MTDTRRPRVCVVSHTYVQSARRRKLHYLAQHADVQLVVPRRFPDPPYGTRRCDAGAAEYAVHAFPALFINPGFSSTRYVLVSRDLGFGAFHPDVIQVENEVHSFSVLQALLYRRLYVPRAKLVVSFWQNQVWPGLRGRVVHLLQRLALPRIDFYLPANHDGAAILRAHGVGDEKIAILPPVGVEPRDFGRLDPPQRKVLRGGLGVDPGEFVVGYCGRLVPEKGLPDLLHAMARLASDQPGWRLMVVGSGPLDDALCQFATANGLRVSILRGLAYDDVPRHLALFDVLVLPSRTTPRWKEQFGRVLVEAMACAVPVVGSDSGEIPRVIDAAGLVFPEGDVAALARALASLRRDADLHRRLAIAGHERAVSMYADEMIARRSMEIYRALLS